jgi:hypothetical protein
MSYRYPPTRAQRHPRLLLLTMLLLLTLATSGILWIDHRVGPAPAVATPIPPSTPQPTGSRWFWQLSQWLPQPSSSP